MEGSIIIEFEYTKFSEGWTFVDAVEEFAANEHPAARIRLTSVSKNVPTAD